MPIHKLASIAALATWLLFTTVVYSIDHSFDLTSKRHQQNLIQQNISDINIQHNVELLNELTERRRINTFFTNQQLLSYGLQKGYVNTSKGNVTFIRRDLVITNRMPIVIARVYDSSKAVLSKGEPSDFSDGWHLTLAQSITQQSDGTLLLKNDNAINIKFIPTNSGYQIAPKQNTDITEIIVNNNNIRINYKNGWHKKFTLMGERYLLKAIVDNNNNQITLSYQNGLLAKVSGDNGSEVTIKRNSRQKIIAIIDHHEREVTYHYDNHSQMKKVIDIGSNQWRYQYHQQKKLHKVIDPKGQIAAKFTYNAENRVKLSKIRATQYRYKYQGQITTVTDTNGKQTRYEHTNEGITTKIINSQGFVSQIKLNQNNQISQLWHNNTQVAEINYDSESRLEHIEMFHSQDSSHHNPQKNAQYSQKYLYKYNQQGKLSKIIAEHGEVYRYLYDDKGNLTDHIIFSNDNKNHHHHYKYNNKGEVKTETIQAKNDLPQTFDYRYNSKGLIKHLSTKDLSTRFNYYPTGKLKNITFPNGATHHYQYDVLGFRTDTIRSDESKIKYDYDNLGNLTHQTNISPNQQTLKQTLTINTDNQVTQVNMTQGEQTFTPVEIKYDGQNNPESLTQGEHLISYQYDNLGRLTDIDNNLDNYQQYQYKPDEADIRIQLDKRTAKSLSTNRNLSGHNQSLQSLLYARMSPTPWQTIDFNGSLDKFLLLAPTAFNNPDAGFQSAKQRTRLFNAIATSTQGQYAFDKASNSFFLPPEYQAINCYYGCEASTYKINKPATAMVGQAVNIEVIEQSKDCLMAYYLDAEGTSTASTTGKFTHIFQTPGLHPIKVRGLCQMCPWASKEVVAYIHVEAAPKCSVDFEITGSNNFRISTTPAMPTIRAQITNKFPAHATIEWSAQIEHTVPNNGACSGVTNTDSPDITATGNTFEPNWGSSIYGGDLFITATCNAPGYESYSKTLEDYEIQGTEPNNTNYTTAFAGGLTTPLDPHDLRRIACKESHLKHFTSNGMPLYGGGGDVGVMQVCYQRRVEHIWNYRSNIAYARQILNGQKTYAIRSLDREMQKAGATQWTQDMLRAETIHRYNAGSSVLRDRYWEWDATAITPQWKDVDEGGIGGYFPSVNSKPANCTQ